jgi:ankyrin repeat protein
VVGWAVWGAPAGSSGDTPLAAAAGAGRRELLLLLVDRGAHLDWMNAQGFTAVMRAALAGHMDTVVALCTCGADPTLVRHPHGPRCLTHMRRCVCVCV